MTHTQIPFLLAMATVNGSPPFAIVVLDDEAAISVAQLAPLAARLGHGLTGQGSVHELLQDWPRNFAALCAAVQALDDPALGKYTRSSVAALEFFDLLAPVAMPRQIFRADQAGDCVPVSTLAGPRAKVPLPAGAPHLLAELAVTAVLGAPTYRASEEEAAASVAGLVAATQYRLPSGRAVSPAFLPTGPYFVPLPFCPDDLRGRISFNGEDGVDCTLPIGAAVSAVARISTDCHLFPGDLVALPMGPQSSVALGDGDIIETAIAGLGQQTTNIMTESKHANRRD